MNNRDKSGKLYKSQMSAVQKYKRENYDVFNVRFPKGDKAEYLEVVKGLGYTSFNQFVIDAINEKIDREA